MLARPMGSLPVEPRDTPFRRVLGHSGPAIWANSLAHPWAPRRRCVCVASVADMARMRARDVGSRCGLVRPTTAALARVCRPTYLLLQGCESSLRPSPMRPAPRGPSPSWSFGREQQRITGQPASASQWSVPSRLPANERPGPGPGQPFTANTKSRMLILWRGWIAWRERNNISREAPCCRVGWVGGRVYINSSRSLTALSQPPVPTHLAFSTPATYRPAPARMSWQRRHDRMLVAVSQARWHAALLLSRLSGPVYPSCATSVVQYDGASRPVKKDAFMPSLDLSFHQGSHMPAVSPFPAQILCTYIN